MKHLFFNIWARKLPSMVLLIGIIVGSCSKPPEKLSPVQASSPSMDASKSMLDPDEAEVISFSGEVMVESLGEGVGREIYVPTLKVTKQNANFIRVLRCKASYELRSNTGVLFDELSGVTRFEDYKWIWNKAEGDYQNCRFVGTHIYRDEIKDIASPSGQYYYLINPCVSKDRSTRGREDCSNDLKKSNLYSYNSVLKEDFIATASKISDMELEVGGATANIKSLAEQIMYEQVACEKIAATKAANGSFFRGIASIAAAVVGGVVGSIIAGPVGAVQGATSFLGIARNLMLKYGPQVDLNCKGAEKHRDNLAIQVERLETAVASVVQTRNEMAELNELYSRLDDMISDDNVGVSP